MQRVCWEQRGEEKRIWKKQEAHLMTGLSFNYESIRSKSQSLQQNIIRSCVHFPFSTSSSSPTSRAVICMMMLSKKRRSDTSMQSAPHFGVNVQRLHSPKVFSFLLTNLKESFTLPLNISPGSKIHPDKRCDGTCIFHCHNQADSCCEATKHMRHKEKDVTDCDKVSFFCTSTRVSKNKKFLFACTISWIHKANINVR